MKRISGAGKLQYCAQFFPYACSQVRGLIDYQSPEDQPQKSGWKLHVAKNTILAQKIG